MFGRPAIALDEVGEKAGLASYGKVRSRFGGFPDVIGNLPASLLPREITTPGELQIRALFVSAGNPVLSVPGRRRARRGAGRARAVRLARLLRQRDEPPRRLHPPEPDLLRARRPAARVPRLLHDAVHPVHRRGRADPPASRARSGRSSTRSRSGSGSCRSRSRRCAIFGRLPGLRPHPRRIAELLLRTGPEGDLLRAQARRPQHRQGRARAARHRPLRAHRDRRAEGEGAPQGIARAARARRRSPPR